MSSPALKSVSNPTRIKIVEKAGNMLRFKGYEGTSLNDLVAEAGVSKGAFFHYYPSKQAISQDIIDQYAEEMKAALDRSLTGTSSVRAGLVHWVTGIFETYKAFGFKGGCLLGNMALELSDRSDVAREQIKGHFLDLENRLVSSLKPLEAEGTLLMEPRQFARLLLSSVQGATLMTKAHKDSNRAAREFMAVGQIIEMVVRD